MQSRYVVAFLGTALGVWLPWVIWAVVNAYGLGHEDAKLGKEQAVYLLSIVGGFLALLSAIASLYAIKQFETKPLPGRATFVITFVDGLILSVISNAAVYRIGYLPLNDSLLFITLAWGVISMAVTYVGLFIYVRVNS